MKNIGVILLITMGLSAPWLLKGENNSTRKGTEPRARDFGELVILSPDSVSNSAPDLWKYCYIIVHPQEIRDILKVVKKNHKEGLYRTSPKDVSILTLRVYPVEGGAVHQRVIELCCRNTGSVFYVYIYKNDKIKDYCFASDVREVTKKEKLMNFTGISIKSKTTILPLWHIPEINARGGLNV